MDAVLNWCKEVETTLLRLDAIPPLGNAPEFPWESCAKKFSAVFDNTECNITPQDWTWREEKDLLAEYSEYVRVIELAASPITHPVYWVLDREHIDRLVIRLMSGCEETTEIPVPQLKEAFTTFIILEAIHTVGSFPSLHGLSPKLINPDAKAKGNCLSRAIRIECGGIHQVCRLLLSEDFVQGIEKHFRPVKSPLSFKSSDIANTLELLLHLEVGETSLSQKEWNSLEPGDFIRLDSCSLDPISQEGSCKITVEGLPLFNAKLSSNGLEVISS
jgi:flagellar motor switch protein FliN